MTGITRMTRMTWSHGSYPVLNKKFKDFLRTFKDKIKISYSSRIPTIALSICLF